MTEKDTLLFEVEFDEKGTTQKAADLRVILERLRTAKKELAQEFKSGAIDAAEYGSSLQSIERQTASAQKQLKTHTKALADNDRYQKAATGSVEQLRAKVILMNAAWDQLSQTERDSTDAGKQLGAQINATTAELLALEQQTGRSQRNVGNYAGSLTGLKTQISDLTKQYEDLSEAERRNADIGGKLKDQIDELKAKHAEETAAVDTSKKSVKDYVQQLNIMGVNVGQTVDTFKSGAQGVGTFAKGIFTARGALVALTAVPIILLLTALVSFLTRSKDGMEFLGRKTAAVTAVFDLFSKKVIAIGRGIVEAFSNPKQALEDLGNIVKQNLINRFEAFKVILDAIKTTDLTGIGNGLIQLFTGVTNASDRVQQITAEARAAAAAGEALALQAQKIADAERLLNVERARSRAEIEKQKLIAEDVSKSQQAREAAARSAFTIENGLLAKQQDLQKQRIGNLKAELALRGTTKEGLDAIAEAEQRLGEIQEESFGKQTELNNKINEIRIQGQQQVIAGQLAVLNEGLRLTRERGFQTLEIEKQILAKQLQLDLVGVVKGSEQEKALRLKYKADLAQLILNDVIEQNERQNRLENDYLQARLLTTRDGTIERLKIEQEAVNQRAFQEEAAARLTIRNQQELAARLAVIDAQKVADKKAIQQQIKDIELKALDDLLAARLAKTKAGSKAEYTVQIEQVRKRINDALKDERIGIEEFQRIQAEGFAQLEDLTDNFNQQLAGRIADSTSQVIDGLSKLFDAQTQRKQKLLDDQQAAALKSAGLSAEMRTRIEENFAKKQEKLQRDAAEKKRKIATAENLIATARAITEAQILPPPFDIIKTVLAIATGAAQQAVIASQQFEYGGEVVDGPLHKQGGVKYILRRSKRVVELEGGEGVINRRSMAIPGVRETASRLNELGGGVRYPGVRGNRSYRTLPRMELGGIVAYQQAQQQAAASIDYDKLGSVVSAMVMAAVTTIPAPITRVVDVRNGLDKFSQLENKVSK